MSSWDILGGDGGDSNNDEEEVEYVGVIEDDAPPVREPMRPERRNVRRVAPRHMPMDQELYSVPQDYKAGAVGASSNRDEEDLVSYIEMPHGKQLGLTPEAIDRLQSTPMGQVNGQMSQRLEPGTYVMYGPSRAGGMGALGTNGKTASSQPFTHSQWAQPSQQEQQIEGLWGSIAGAVADLTVGITGAAVGSASSRREEAAARYAAELERDAASEAAQIGLQTAMLEQQVRLAEIEAGSDQLTELQAQLAARSGAPPVVGGGSSGGGTSPVVWVLVAGLGLAAVGGVFYVATKKK